jgi:transposase
MARKYDIKYKAEAVKLAEELGVTKASKQLNIPMNTLDGWVRKSRKGELTGGSPSPEASLSLYEENKQLKEEIKELKRTNEILSEATAFFATRQKK